MTKKAVITGILGQDGSYLCELLLEKGYEVHGIVRPLTQAHTHQNYNILLSKGANFKLHYCDLNNFSQINDLIESVKPAECYHLAATHFSSETTIKGRLEISRDLYQNNVLSALNLLTAIRDKSPFTKIILAGSCLMYDNTKTRIQDESTPFDSSSIYGLSKIAAAELGIFFRNHFGTLSSNAILFNHESPRRGIQFVTQKIAQNVAKIKRGQISRFSLGDIHIQKDWGYAPDYVNAMWLMAQQNESDNYVIASGETHSIQEFLVKAFEFVGINDWETYVKINKDLTFSTQTPLQGSSNKAKSRLDWHPSISFTKLVESMVIHALENRM